MGFGTWANPTATIGGLAAQVASVSPTRIKGTLPAHANPTASLVDVDVKVGTVTKTLAGGIPIPGFLNPRYGIRMLR